MNSQRLSEWIDALITEEISSDDHARLQQLLKEDSAAREIFRERLDLEAGLRTLAMEPDSVLRSDVTASETESPHSVTRFHRRHLVSLAIATSVLLAIGIPFSGILNRDNQEIFDKQSLASNPQAGSLLGTIRQQDNCKWELGPKTGDRLAAGRLALSEGVAQLGFDSGTEITLEAPCEIDVTSSDSAELLSGTVFVSVTELSNGFTLNTPESQIIDEGTQYAVSIDDDATEVHVFDGRVVWIPEATGRRTDAELEDRINAGEAKRYLRSTPTKANIIPFGQRQFVRQLEQTLKESAGDSLFVYDGFENLAGRIRRGRSGFGWADGWQTGGIGRGRLADVVQTPDDVLFGLDRTERRQLAVMEGDDIRRVLEQPIDLANGSDLFISLILERKPSTASDGSQAIQISLEPDLPGRGRRLHQIVSFGISSEGFPFINSGKAIATTASQFPVNQPHLVVLKLEATPEGVIPTLRIYAPQETVDASEPFLWTVSGQRGTAKYPAHSLRIIAGDDAMWFVDELKIGSTWQAVTTP